MKTKVLALAALIFAAGTTAAFAKDETKKECDKTKKECRQQRCDGEKKAFKDFNPFEGITLTAEQQQKLEAIKAERPCDKTDAKKCDKAKKDSECKEKCDGKQGPTAARKAYFAKVKEILTPEQYVTFLENVKSHAPHKGKMHKGDRRHRSDKGQRSQSTQTENK